MLRSTFFLALLTCLASCEPAAVQPPARATGVPNDAIWAGGRDGGAWIRCQQETGTRDRYYCATYFESTGKVWAEGLFILRHMRWDHAADRLVFSEVKTPPDSLRYSFFDGQVIHLRDSLVLVQPDYKSTVRYNQRLYADETLQRPARLNPGVSLACLNLGAAFRR